MSWNTLKSVVLGNDALTLRPVAAHDLGEFAKVAFDPEIWRYFVFAIESPADLEAFVGEAVRDTAAGTRVVFAVVDRRSGSIAGSTAYGNLSEKERRLEIGWSWLGSAYRGSGLNRAAKFLLLEHAFEALGCERVEFKTDALNLRARRALQGIGAIEEGTLRSFNYMPGGRRRNAVYYSVLRAEWPALRARHLESLAS